jgi:hypothetical protein
MKETAEIYSGKGVMFVGVSRDAPDKLDRVREVIATNAIPYAVGIDTQDVARDYGVSGIPHVVVVDPSGQIRFRQTGFSADDHSLATALDALLAGKEPPRPPPLTENEKEAIAEEQAAMKSFGNSLRTAELDTNRFTRLWTSTNAIPRDMSELWTLAPVATAPSTYSLASEGELLVVDAISGETLHRIPLNAGLRKKDALNSSPQFCFLRSGTGGVAVVFQKKLARQSGGQRNSFRVESTKLTGLSPDGAILWERTCAMGASALETLADSGRVEVALVRGYDGFELIDASGEKVGGGRVPGLNSLRIGDVNGNGRPDFVILDGEPRAFEWNPESRP